MDNNLAWCSRCRSHLDKSLFTRSKHRSLGVKSWCKTCCASWARDNHRLNPEIHRQRVRQSRLRHAGKHAAYAKAARVRLKEEMIAAYGGFCSCCRETNHEFLTLEHIRGDGQKHRRECHGNVGAWADLKRRGWPKDDYTILCMNCNWSKARHGYCPHNQIKLVVVK